MSDIGFIINEKKADIGNFMVGRLLPSAEKRMVGPFVFIDHMGPAILKASENMDVLPHPHIGLSTLTYLLEGSITHRDSIGSVIDIHPGAVNWMTAGKGVVHSERTPDYLRNKNKTVHGLQIWVALPKEYEETDASFMHIPASDLPQWNESGCSIKLIAGEALGRKSTVPVYSPLYLLEIKSINKTKINLVNHLFGENALFILEGKIKSGEQSYTSKHLLIPKNIRLTPFEIEENTTIYIFGGEPFPEKRYIHWNFVSSRRELIEKAKQGWIERKFPRIPGETEFASIPS